MCLLEPADTSAGFLFVIWHAAEGRPILVNDYDEREVTRLKPGISPYMKLFQVAIILITCALAITTMAGTKATTVRWDETKPGCTFSRGDDGRYRYGLWTDDLGVTMAIDSQELQKSRKRMGPFIGVFLEFRYRGKDSVSILPGHITLEFASHAHVIHPALDPQTFSEHYQDLADAAAKYNQRETEKHPDKKDLYDTRIEANEKELVEMQEFLGTRCLKAAKLSPVVPNADGWVLFRSTDKWIGGWKQQEQLVLRIPIDGRIFEIPFQLPPTAGDLILRKR